ncbi:MAG TPA: RagB/SusD family nutrient uptake outer membrane protein [Bacteroidales bacterium]|nr:RagB/SusD family nutrient uptake outer membrane protein [Bacteroidales bacterium]
MKPYIFFIALLFLGISCGKDFLEENPKGVLDPGIFFSSSQIQLAADNLPAELSRIWSQAGCVGPFMGGDDLTTHPASNKERFREVDLFSATGVNDRIQLWWDGCYATIRAANAILTNVDQSSASESLKDDARGQAYFYRGLSYSFLTRIFGRVPLVLEFNVNPDLGVQKAEVAAIYDQIVSDLQNAESFLPNIRPEGPSDRGGYPGARPCKGTVKAVMSQVYLTMAGWPLKETSNYAMAAIKAKEVIDNAGVYQYALEPDPNDLWTWANNFTNQEIVFALYYNYNIGQVSMHGPLGPRPEEYVNPAISWASGWSDYYGEVSFFNRFPAGPRKDATYQTMIPIKNVGDVPWDDDRTYRKHPYFKKYQDEFPGASWAGSRAEQIIRYAEVLLNYAEAQAMADGAPNSDAYAAINAVRNRAGLPDLTPGLSGVAFRDSVIVERGWEFAGGEAASRWFDLIRTEAVEQANALRDPSEIPLSNQPSKEHYWMPIPDIEISYNPNLEN